MGAGGPPVRLRKLAESLRWGKVKYAAGVMPWRELLHGAEPQLPGGFCSSSAVGCRIIEQLIRAPVATPRAIGQHVFELYQPSELTAQRTVAPAELFTQLTLREAHRISRHVVQASLVGHDPASSSKSC